MKTIEGIIGHDAQCAQLMLDLEADNVAHAYLFAGEKHLGKMTVARRFGEMLLVEGASDEKAESIKSQCKRLTYSDLLILDMLWIDKIHDDWKVISKYSNVPQQHRSKKPPAKSDVISIDDIRALQHKLQEISLSKYKVCIIRGIERMQDASANALLKILEEPPKGLVFILTTESSSSLLPTIVSRTRTLRFNRLSNKQLLPGLQALSEDDRRFVLGLSQGAPGIALKLAEDADLLREQKQVHAQAHSFWKTRSLRERLKLLKPLEKKGEDADEFLLHLALSLRERHDDGATQALMFLANNLRTNAHRQMLLQRFALSLSA